MIDIETLGALWLGVGFVGAALTVGYQMDRSTRDERIAREVATWDALRALPRPKHAVMVQAVDPGGHRFRGSCSCDWRGPVRRDKQWAARDASGHIDEVQEGRPDGDAPSAA